MLAGGPRISFFQKQFLSSTQSFLSAVNPFYSTPKRFILKAIIPIIYFCFVLMSFPSTG